MDNLLSLGTFVVLVSGLVEVVKRATKLPSDWCPLLSVVFGITIGLFSSSLAVFGVERIFIGAFIGLGACGLYDGIKVPVEFAIGQIKK